MQEVKNLSKTENSAGDKISVGFVSGIIMICTLIFVLGISIGMESVTCKCVQVSIKGSESSYNPGYDTVHVKLGTTYYPSVAQCDSTPNHTADGSYIDPGKLSRREISWCALSRDLLARWGGPFDYGNTLHIQSEDHSQMNGVWEVHDCKGDSNSGIDFLVAPENNKPKLGRALDIKILIRKS